MRSDAGRSGAWTIGAAVLAALIAGCAVPAAARPTGQAPQASADPRNPALMRDFANCLYVTDPAKAEYFLEHSDAYAVGPFPGLDNVEAYLGVGQCRARQPAAFAAINYKPSIVTLRGMLAEQAYLARNAAYPGPKGIVAIRRYYVSPDPKVNANARGMALFSDCLVSSDSENADALLRTVPGSDAERAAAQLIAPALGKCLLGGQTIPFKPQDVRWFAAEGLWQRYLAPGTPPSAPVVAQSTQRDK